MNSFEEFGLQKQLNYAITDLGFTKPTPIQKETFNVILSGRDIVGIAQTGTGKTFAYMLPILEELKFSKDMHPRVLVLVPTRELVLQVVENIKSYCAYLSHRILGVYGGTNINTQAQYVAQGCDILVATPGRLRDLKLNGYLQLKSIKKLVIDEVDVMLDLGFRPQLESIFDLLPKKRQNVLFSATMTDEVDLMLQDYFTAPEKIQIAVSGTPLDNIEQSCFSCDNYYTKVNLLEYLLKDKQEFKKTLVFVGSKKVADRLHENLERYSSEMGIVHSNKSQNYRERSVSQFDEGKNRILITTDVMARGLDLDKISHVINFDTPNYPENYMHRIGRTGRANEKGKTILFYTEKEHYYKEQIEELMNMKINEVDFPSSVQRSSQLAPEERPVQRELNLGKKIDKDELPPGFHKKKEKNMKTNEGGSYRKKLKAKYKKSQTRGDKIQNMKAKKRKK